MIAAIGTVNFDIFGSMKFRLDPSSKVRDFNRRVTRTATLDGNADIIDNGYAAADATFVLKIVGLDEAAVLNLERIVKSHSEFRLFTRAGAFLGTVANLNTDIAPVALTFLPRQLISE